MVFFFGEILFRQFLKTIFTFLEDLKIVNVYVNVYGKKLKIFIELL